MLDIAWAFNEMDKLLLPLHFAFFGKGFFQILWKKGQKEESKCELERLLGELGRTELRNACFLHTLLRKLVAESVHNGAFILPPQL